VLEASVTEIEKGMFVLKSVGLRVKKNTMEIFFKKISKT
jgi:hypothetical protein